MPQSSGVLQLVLIKPTHYDDNGYPIQWLRSAIPSNTLACLNGLAEDCRGRKVLGDDVDIRITTYDETNRRVYPDRIIKSLRKQGGRSLIALVGVQSNQFPRALDLARRFREAGLQVAIGGFHVSGCISMLKEIPDDMKEAQRLGISLFAGEAEEGRLDTVLKDAYAGTLAAALQLHVRPAGHEQPAHADPARATRAAHGRHLVERRPRPWLPLPVLVLHHHQRAGAQEPVPVGRRPGGRHPRQRGAEHQPLLHHRRQLRAQPQLGGLLRPPHHAARGAGLRHQVHDPGGYAVPSDPQLRREGRAGRRRARVHRPGEHQSRQPARRQEEAEPNHRLPRHAAGVEEAGLHHLRRLHPGLPQRPQGDDPARHRDHQARAARRHPGVLHPHAAAGLGGPQGPARQGHLDGPGHEQVRPQPPGRASPHHVGCRVGGRLLVGLGVVLFA